MVKIIAELCQNHNGDPNTLTKMVEAAARAGATHVKIQNIYADSLTYRPQFENGHSIDGIIKSIKRPYAKEYERLKKLELDNSDIEKFIKLCEELKVVPLTTCFARDNIKDINNLGFKSIKVASYDCASFQMLRELKENFSELIISTGATYDQEIIYASRILDGHNFSFLHCITIYPTPLDMLNLARIKWLKKFSKTVGFSDHTLVEKDHLKASKLAITLGASIIERHFTILSKEETKDGPVSINEKELTELVSFSKLNNNDQLSEIYSWNLNIDKIIGNEVRKLSDNEILNRDYYRGRFASKRFKNSSQNMIYNWEELDI